MRLRPIEPLLLLFLVGLLAGCGTTYKRSPVVTPQKFSCTGGAPAEITLYSPEEAKLSFEEKSYDLERIQTGSGVKYGNRSVSFWNKGIDAMITRDDGSMVSCTVIPRTGL